MPANETYELMQPDGFDPEATSLDMPEQVAAVKTNADDGRQLNWAQKLGRCVVVVAVISVVGLALAHFAATTAAHQVQHHSALLTVLSRYEGYGLFGFKLDGAAFTWSNYFSKVNAYQMAATSMNSPHYRTEKWFHGLTASDPMVGVKLGQRTQLFYSYVTNKEKLKQWGDMERRNQSKRENELGLSIYNRVPFPEVGTLALGFDNADHAWVRPYYARIFDHAIRNTTFQYLRKFFKSEFACRSTLSNGFTGDAGVMVQKALHMWTLSSAISDDEAKDIISIGLNVNVLGYVPKSIANSVLLLLKWKTLRGKEKWIDRIKAFIQKKWPSPVEGGTWTAHKLTVLAVGLFDVFTQAGGKAVPSVIDYMIGLMATNWKYQPSALFGVDFTNSSNLEDLMWEVMRYFPVVSGVPRWVRNESLDPPWQHEILEMGRSSSDPSVFPQPDVFKLGRKGMSSKGSELSIAYADFATVDGDFANPNAHSCPGKKLSQLMIQAFMQEYMAAGQWVAKSDEIKFNLYSPSKYTVWNCKPASA